MMLYDDYDSAQQKDYDTEVGQYLLDQEDQEENTVLGFCPHGVNLDREFCPKGCRV